MISVSMFIHEEMHLGGLTLDYIKISPLFLSFEMSDGDVCVAVIALCCFRNVVHSHPHLHLQHNAPHSVSTCIYIILFIDCFVPIIALSAEHTVCVYVIVRNLIHKKSNIFFWTYPSVCLTFYSKVNNETGCGGCFSGHF